LDGIISADDFEEPIFHQAASLVFEEYRQTGHVTPARILNQFEEKEDQKTVAALFNTKLKTDDDPAIREKALNETVIRIRRHSLEQAGRKVKDVAELQKIIQEKAKLQKLHLSL
jgi:DNA primase